MKNLIIVTGIILFSITKMSAQTPTKSKADLAWEAMPLYNFKEFEANKFQYAKAKEIFNRKFLEAGYEFWKQFPNDKRWVGWFIKIRGTSGAPKFWRDLEGGAKASIASNFYVAPIDWKLFESWEQRLLIVRENFMSDKNIEEEYKRRLLYQEMETEFWRCKNASYRKSKVHFVKKIKDLILNTFTAYKSDVDFSAARRYAEIPFLYSADYELNQNDLIDILNYLVNSNNRELVKWASKKLLVYKLSEKPFELKHHTVEGREIDLVKLRGKVILVDFWSTSCSTCIERMPAVRQVYEKYKDRGFVVISVAYNPNVDKERILAIHHKIGADWPVMLIGGEAKSGFVAPNSLGNKIWKKYGFNYVPQMLLLDKQGKLALYNGDLLNGDFEPIVKELLEN